MARHAGGRLLLVIATVLSLVLGALGFAAQADEPPAPTSTASPDASEPTEPGPGDLPSPSPDEEPSTGSEPPGVLRDLLGPAPEPGLDRLVLQRGTTASLHVTANDTCPPSSTCTATLVAGPAGWPISLDPNTGVLTVRAPARTVPNRYTIQYQYTEDNPAPTNQAPGTVVVDVTADAYTPPGGIKFSHPYRKRHRENIRSHILRSIDSVPSGERIQIMSWSFSSKSYRRALKAAKARGVAVQLVIAKRNTRRNSDYRKLVNSFGTTVTPTGSWVKKCTRSCRGTGGTMHSKIFLFSRVFNTPFVMMSGSANLTDFAVTNQWNQMSTMAGHEGIYNDGLRIFHEAVVDRPAPQRYVETPFGAVTNIYYPVVGVSPSTDYLYRALNHVQCRGAANTRSGRTEIRIAVYAWYQDRGKWLAKKVRKLWTQGCKVSIIYGISSNPVKKILFSPNGRGRIPIRQILLTNRNLQPIYYVHDKWMAIRGHYAGKAANDVAIHGSANFSNLSFASDENLQALYGAAYSRAFARDFKRMWKSPQARAPSPTSKIPTIEGRYTRNDLRLGRGRYVYMEAN